MNLKDLAAKPQLIKMIIDDEEIVKEYNEPLEFYAYDKQPMDVFLRVASSRSQNVDELGLILKDMILDSDGQPVIKDGLMLPSKVLMAAFTKLVEVLGK